MMPSGYLARIMSRLAPIGDWRSAATARHLGLLLGSLLAGTAGMAQAAVEPSFTLRPDQPPQAVERQLSDVLSLPAAPVASVPILLATHQSAGSPAASAPKAMQVPSGLAWQSGMQCYTDEFGAWRGRAVDVNSLYLGRTSWGGVLATLKGPVVERAKVRPGPLVFALAMLMPGQKFSDCNAGKLDANFTDIGKALNTTDLKDSIIRLGWEANGTSYAWSIGSQVEPYKACFKRLVTVLRKQVPGLQIEWSMRRDNGASVGAHLLYPGDDVVNIIGTSAYDRYPSLNTQKQWDAEHKATKQGGPKGLGTWLDLAKIKKKKFAISEWALSLGFKSPSEKF